MLRQLMIGTLVLMLSAYSLAAADDAGLREEGAVALRKASDFYINNVSTEGGYLWKYSEDLSKREGENRATDTMVWIQPPGTPSVGMAFLEVYRDTGDEYFLEAAKQAGYCLIAGQLRSGGWDYLIDFNPENRKRYAYRVDGPAGKSSQRNTTVLDDNTTQAALRLLMALDQTLEFKDARIHEAAEYALSALLAAQYPNGAWPQRFDEPPDAAKYPIKKASYPESWSRTFPKEKYSSYYTFNDNALADVIDVMFRAADVYGDSRYRKSAEQGGDFMLLAQMPDPQPAWAQQYNADMEPAWARKFEPPSVTGGESQGVMRSLMQVYRETGNKKYLEPLPRALAYLKSSILPDGRLARFYELKTNRPLYFTKDYQLTYSDADMPTHYAFKVDQRLDRIEQEYQRLLTVPVENLSGNARRKSKPGKASSRLQGQVRQVIDQMDSRGAWVEDGSLATDKSPTPDSRIIDNRTFIRNIGTLGQYLAASPD